MYRSKLDPEKDPAGATPVTLALALLQPRQHGLKKVSSVSGVSRGQTSSK